MVKIHPAEGKTIRINNRKGNKEEIKTFFRKDFEQNYKTVPDSPQTSYRVEALSP